MTGIIVQLMLVLVGVGAFVVLVDNYLKTGKDIPNGILTVLGLIFGQIALNLIRTMSAKKGAVEEPKGDDAKEGEEK